VIAPAWIDAVLATYDQKTEPHNEVQIADALGSARKGLGDLSDEDVKAILAEHSAFFFIENVKEKSVWGTYFAPMAELTRDDGGVVRSPDIESLDQEILEHWRERAKRAKNPMMRARYADLVWDFGKMLGDAKRDYQSALIAIESYLEAANKRFYANPIEGVKWIVRALNISLSIGSQDGARAAAGAMFNLVESDANLMNIGVWIAPFDYFYDKRDLLTAGQKAKIVSDLENILARVSVSNPETNEFDPWGAQAAAERLAQHYKGQGAKSEAERVIKSYGASFEFLAKQASPMMAMAWLQPVIERLEQENLKADAERVQNLASENGKNIASDLKTCSVKVDLDKDKVEAEIEAIVSGEQLHAALMRVADYFMPKADFARRLVEEQKKTAPLLSMITSVIVRPDGQPEAIIGSAEDDEEGRLHHQISQHMAFVQPLLRATLHRLVRKFSVSADHFVDFIFQSPIFLESRQPLIQAGMQAYLDGDFIKAIHVLVPQVEDTLRSLAAKAGIPIYKTVRGASGITDVKSMNNVLEDARVRDMLGENLWRYLTVLYIDRRGLNLRNDLAHGLVSPQSFNQLIGDRVVHSLIVLGMIRAKAPVQQASRASGDQP
jgi:hypothetical protein